MKGIRKLIRFDTASGRGGKHLSLKIQVEPRNPTLLAVYSCCKMLPYCSPMKAFPVFLALGGASCLGASPVKDDPQFGLILLNPKAEEKKRVTEAARFIAQYTCRVLEGLDAGMGGTVVEEAKGRWVVRYPKLKKQVRIAALAKKDEGFKKLDRNSNGWIDSQGDFDYKEVFTYRPQNLREEKVSELPKAAALMQRIDRRVTAIAGKHAGLAAWGKEIKTVKRKGFGTEYLEIDPRSSGKLLQLRYVADLNRYHRLVYHNRDNHNRCSLSFRVISSATGRTLAGLYDPWFPYGDGWVIAEEFAGSKELRAELIRVLQEESLQEPGKAGIEYRGWMGAHALAHHHAAGSFPDLRWQRPGRSQWQTILKRKGEVIFLCPPLKLKTGYNPALPVTAVVEEMEE